jgi:hypothetical protein
VGGAPAPFWRHFTQNLNLLRAGLFVGQHKNTMLDSAKSGKPATIQATPSRQPGQFMRPVCAQMPESMP